MNVCGTCEQCGKISDRAIIVLRPKTKTSIEVSSCKSCELWRIRLGITECDVCDKSYSQAITSVLDHENDHDGYHQVLFFTSTCGGMNCIQTAKESHVEVLKKFGKKIGVKSKDLITWVCDVCHKHIKTRLKCSVCNRGSYCGDECFAKIWKEHKRELHRK